MRNSTRRSVLIFSTMTLAALSGCGATTDSVPSVGDRNQPPTPSAVSVAEVSANPPIVAPAINDTTTSPGDETTTVAQSSPTSPGSDDLPASAPADEPKHDDQSASSPPAAAGSRNRVSALGQFGGGGMGGGMMGGGGMGGGGMGGGGMMGGMGDGMGGGGGGVAIDPKIQLKKDGTGKLDASRREATKKRPTRGSFSTDK